MHLVFIDWLIIVLYCVAAFGIGIWFSRTKSTEDYFLAGRKLNWFIAGTSMAAAGFATDTPLMISGFIRSGGIYLNWFCWISGLAQMVTVFYFARLWTRCGILTDAEFIESRYSGVSASGLRVFMALFMGVLYCVVATGWVMLAGVKIFTTLLIMPDVFTFNLGLITIAIPSKIVVVGDLLLLALLYTAFSGLFGVVSADVFHYIVAMGGSLALAGFIMWQMGGPTNFAHAVTSAPNVTPGIFEFIPTLKESGGIAVMTFLFYITVLWIGGATGSGMLAQRMLSCKNEKHSALSMLWANFLMITARSWPWIIVGLGSLVFFPLSQKMDPELAYPKMIVKFMPIGLRGLMIASFMAAFLNTVPSLLNLGGSYFINDIYSRFVKQNATQKHYVFVSRVATIMLTLVAVLVSWKLHSIRTGWEYISQVGIGAAFLSVARWFWWRINAWSEISAMITSVILANIIPYISVPGIGSIAGQEFFVLRLAVIFTISALVWISVTFLTSPVEEKKLVSFYRRVRPGGWWGPIAARCPDIEQDRAANGFLGCAGGIGSIYSSLFAIGYFCLGKYYKGVLACVVCVLTSYLMITGLKRIIRQPQKTAMQETMPQELRS